MVDSPTEKELELKYRLSAKKIDAVVTIGKALIKYSSLVLCIYFIYGAIGDLAGKRTFASLGFSLLGSLKLDKALYGVLTGGGLVYGFGQRQLRHRLIKRLAGDKKRLEMAVDPNRTSSNLTPWGTTKPEDKLR